MQSKKRTRDSQSSAAANPKPLKKASAAANPKPLKKAAAPKEPKPVKIEERKIDR